MNQEKTTKCIGSSVDVYLCSIFFYCSDHLKNGEEFSIRVFSSFFLFPLKMRCLK